ncbi:MAG: hypothetical protein Q9160_002866 [Pyrenula sp. 1 TL-2023]
MQTVVRDLWTLRLAKLASRLEVPNPEAVETVPETLDHSDMKTVDPEPGIEQSTANVAEKKEARRRKLKLPGEYQKALDTSGRKQAIRALPEIRLMALVTVVTKLFYAFDDGGQHPRNLQEPAAQNVDWPRWIEMHTNENQREEGSSTNHTMNNFGVVEKDALAMTGEEVDKYLDWYQQTWIKTDMEVEGAHKEILDLFPLPHVTSGAPKSNPEQDFENEVTADLIRSQSFRVNKQPITDEEADEYEEGVARPGSFYKSWRTKEDLSPSARAFVDIAADTIGVTVDTLLLGVAQIERSITRWKDNERRREAFPDQDDDSIEENNDDSEGEAVDDRVGAAVEDMARMSIDGDLDHETDTETRLASTATPPRQDPKTSSKPSTKGPTPPGTTPPGSTSESYLSKIYSFEDIQSLISTLDPKRILIGKPPSPSPPPFQALFLTPEEFEDRFEFARPDEDTEVVFYCKAGVRSRAAAKLARQAGFGGRTAEFPGSWGEWVGRGGVVER